MTGLKQPYNLLLFVSLGGFNKILDLYFLRLCFILYLDHMSVDVTAEQDRACTQEPELLYSSQGQHSFQRGHLSSNHSLDRGKKEKGYKKRLL